MVRSTLPEATTVAPAVVRTPASTASGARRRGEGGKGAEGGEP